MRILVIGGGGREHALVWKLRQSPRVKEIVCAPGNGGIAQLAECTAVDTSNLDSLVRLAARVQPALTVVGPEAPLAMGLVDELRGRGRRVFGPTRAAAQLEASKSFAKQFMVRQHVPTAHFAVCGSRVEVQDALGGLHAPVVVKADGLAAGKGVVIAQSKEEAAAAAEAMLGGEFGAAGSRVVIEEFLQGDELSFLVMSDGTQIAPLAAARDHKRIGEGDTGPNTGGMGAYSDRAMLDDNMRAWLVEHIVRPVIAGMKEDETPYTGVLYAGLMMTARGPMVLEFNARFGDPETQAILLRLEGDLLEALEASVEGRLSENELRWSQEASCCVVLAAGGYPGKYESGKAISGLEQAARVEGVQIFHAGTVFREGSFYSAGGRVLNLCARGRDLEQARERVYRAAELISFEGMQYRKDIGKRGDKETR